MKTKIKLTVILFLSILMFSMFLKADDVTILIIKKPEALAEGIQKELTAAQIAELIPWAKDSKLFLTDLLDNTQNLPTIEKIDRFIDGIKQVVGESALQNSELFMRYVLNRALVLYELLEKEMEASAVGTADAKSRVLILSIKMAVKYYDVDREKLINNKKTPLYASFGMEYFNFLTELNKSIFDASAEYNIARTSLEWLQWDLYRDLNNTSYAPKILKINNALKTFPSKKLNDNQSINYIRQMKKIIQQLDLLVKIPAVSKVKDEAPYDCNVFNKNKEAILTISGGYHYHVITRQMYANKLVDVEHTDQGLRGEHRTVDCSALSYSLSVLEHLRVGTSAVRTVNRIHYHVFIKEIFADKTVWVEYTDKEVKGQNGTVPYKELSYSSESSGDFKINMEAIQTVNGNHYHVIIRELFADGTIEVEYTRGPDKGKRGYVSSRKTLSLAIDQ